jgi:hypothetical protein
MTPTFNIYKAEITSQTKKERLDEVFETACNVVYRYYPKSFARLFSNKGDTEEVFYRRIILYLTKSKGFKYREILEHINKKGYDVKIHHLVDGYTIIIHWILFAPTSERSIMINEMESELNKKLNYGKK